jgi:ribosomal protein L7/L12
MEWIAPAFVLVGVIMICATVAQTNQRLARTERKLNALLRHFGIEPNQGPPLSDRVKELARDPEQKIAAIKVYREETGVSLREAKEAVEAFMNSL